MPGDDVVRVADEDRAVADAREALDVLDHLGVVVGGQERLALAAAGIGRKPTKSVSHAYGAVLQLGVLVQEVVDLPRLVADPEVERLLAHEVVEDHEVRAQDLVHPPDRLERVQVVLAGLAVDVRRLGGELARWPGGSSRRARAQHRASPAPGRATRSRARARCRRSSSAIATSRQAWPRPIGDETNSARLRPRASARPRAPGAAACRRRARRTRAAAG